MFVQRGREACWQDGDGGQLGKGRTISKAANGCQPMGSSAMNSILAPYGAARTLEGKASWTTWSVWPPDARAPSQGKTACPRLAWKHRASCLHEDLLGLDHKHIHSEL